jgi:Protein of unknown function (DUF664)/DinB superfamily/Pentapeptide repeats (8 copies)
MRPTVTGMSDTDCPWEPPLAGTEAEHLIGALDRLRTTFRWKADGLDAAGLRTRIGASALTLGGLLKHLAVVEDHISTTKLTGEPLGAPWDAAIWDDRQASEFTSAACDTPAQLYATWEGAVARSRARFDAALACGGLDQPVHAAAPDGRHASLRRLLCDLIEEYGRHTGHADLLREAVDGLIGEDPPAGWRPGLSQQASDDHRCPQVFHGADLRGARFERTDLTGADLRAVDLSRAHFRGCAFHGAVMRGVELGHVTIDGEIEDLTINGVDVGPFIEAELSRRDPDRAAMRPSEPAGFSHAWDVVERLWAGTVDRARRMAPELLHESVDGEWSFIETLRHLVFASDAWIRRAVLGDPSPWDPLDLPWDEMPDTPGVPRDRSVRPSLDQVLELRRDRMSTVRQVIGGLTDASLDAPTQPVTGPGWPPPHSFTARECLLVILNEEYHHRLFAERDLDALVPRGS